MPRKDLYDYNNESNFIDPDDYSMCNVGGLRSDIRLFYHRNCLVRSYPTTLVISPQESLRREFLEGVDRNSYFDKFLERIDRNSYFENVMPTE